MSADPIQPLRCTQMNAQAVDLNQEFARIRTDRRMTRKEFARVTGIPASRIEKIECERANVSLESLRRLARLPEGKALAARLFQIEYENQAEMHALIARLQELTGGR